MKLTAKKLLLQTKSEQAAGIVAGSSDKVAPVLKNLLFEVKTTPVVQLRIIATDADLSMIASSTMITADEPGIALLPAKRFMDIIKECGDVDVTIETTTTTATISTPLTRWSIQLMQEKFPNVPEPTDLIWHKFPADPFVKGIRKVRGAVAKEDVRPELQLIKCGPDGIFATDGARLHHSKVVVPMAFEMQANACDDLLRVLRNTFAEEVSIAETKSHILFSVNSDVFMATKLGVEFPDSNHIIESANICTMELQLAKADLISAIKRTRITADEETNRIILSIGKDLMTVKTRDKLNNSCQEALLVHWDKEPMELSTNHRFLQEAIGEMESPNIVIKFGKDIGQRKAPILIQEDSFVSIINQLRTVDEPKVAGVAKPA